MDKAIRILKKKSGKENFIRQGEIIVDDKHKISEITIFFKIALTQIMHL